MKRLILWVSLLTFTLTGKAEETAIYDEWQVIHTDLYLDVRNIQEETLYGVATITMRTKEDGLWQTSLLLEKMTIDSVYVDGKAISDYTYNNKRLDIPLGTSVEDGAEFTFRIVYHGKPTGSDFGGFLFHKEKNMAHNMGSSIHDVPHSFGRSWFPAVDDYRSRSTFDLRIQVTDPLKGIGSGVLVDTIPADDHSAIWHWQVKQPIPDYLVSIAVGEYEKVHLDYHQTNRILPIDIYVLPDEVEKAKEAYADLPDILSIFEDRFGEYAFDRVGFVTINGTSGAMEHVGNIAMPPLSTHPMVYRELIIHELSHAWFGNKVTCASEGDMWLNEGFATFSPLLIYEELYPEVPIAMYRRQMQLIAWMAPAMEGGYHALKGMPDAYTFMPSNYYKGGMAVNMLRGIVGDSLFMPTMEEYLELYKFNHITTDDFKEFLTSRLPDKHLEDFFDMMIYRPGFISFEIDSIKGQMTSEDMFQGNVYLEQKLFHAPEWGNQVRVPVTFFDSSGEWGEKRYLTASGQYSEQAVELPFQPAFGIVDFDYEICKASFCDTVLIADTGQYFKQFTPLILECSSLEMPFKVFLETYKVPADAPDASTGIDMIPAGYWRVAGTIPETTKLKGIFAPDRSDVEISQVFASEENTLFMMFREHAGKPWQTLYEIDEEMKNNLRLTVEELRLGEYSIGIKK